jgi:hypothetical protein
MKKFNIFMQDMVRVEKGFCIFIFYNLNKIARKIQFKCFAPIITHTVRSDAQRTDK